MAEWIDLLDPGEEELKKVLPKVPPEFRQRWEKLRPDGKTTQPVSRTVINRAYLDYLKAHSSK